MDAISEPGDIIDSIRTQLEGLKRTEDGMLLYRLIERGLGKRPDDTGGTDEAFLTFLYTLLERYAKNRDGDPITRIKVRVIQQRITPYLLKEEEPVAAPVTPQPVHASEPEPVIETAPEPEQAAAPEPVEEQAAAVEEPNDVAATSELDSLELMPDLAAELERGPVAEPEPEQVAAPEPIEEKAATVEEPEPEKVAPVRADKPAERPEPIKPVKAEELLNQPTRPVEKKPAKPSQEAAVAKPSPAKKKTAVAKKKAGPDNSSGSATKPQVKAEPEARPRKRIKLELVDPTDLTKPHVAAAPKKEEDYIDLGADEETIPKQPVVKPVPKKPVPANPEKKAAKQELLPRKPGKKSKAPNKPSGSGEPSQERVEKLHEAFVHKMAESITKSQEYHRMLRSHMKAIELADNENDFRDLKTLLLRGMDDLLKGNEALGRDLDSTSHYLKIARLDRALLKDELGRIKDNTTIDELTALQNKDAFIKQLESEISRVNRYGFSFAIAVLDIDDLKKINSTYGRDAGDEIIRCYARQILSQFRSYDLVARHRDDEFLLLFPNTQKEGAMRAVEKAQKKASNLFINHKDKNIKVPTFTSVLTTYSPGDKPDTLLKRTTDALVEAQKRGRDQVILALPTA